MVNDDVDGSSALIKILDNEEIFYFDQKVNSYLLESEISKGYSDISSEFNSMKLGSPYQNIAVDPMVDSTSIDSFVEFSKHFSDKPEIGSYLVNFIPYNELKNMVDDDLSKGKLSNFINKSSNDYVAIFLVDNCYNPQKSDFELNIKPNYDFDHKKFSHDSKIWLNDSRANSVARELIDRPITYTNSETGKLGFLKGDYLPGTWLGVYDECVVFKTTPDQLIKAEDLSGASVIERPLSFKEKQDLSSTASFKSVYKKSKSKQYLVVTDSGDTFSINNYGFLNDSPILNNKLETLSNIYSKLIFKYSSKV